MIVLKDLIFNLYQNILTIKGFRGRITQNSITYYFVRVLRNYYEDLFKFGITISYKPYGQRNDGDMRNLIYSEIHPTYGTYYVPSTTTLKETVNERENIVECNLGLKGLHSDFYEHLFLWLYHKLIEFTCEGSNKMYIREKELLKNLKLNEEILFWDLLMQVNNYEFFFPFFKNTLKQIFDWIRQRPSDVKDVFQRKIINKQIKISYVNNHRKFRYPLLILKEFKIGGIYQKEMNEFKIFRK